MVTTYKDLVEAYTPYRSPKRPVITGKTPHGHYLKSYSGSGYCEADGCLGGEGGEKKVGLYKFRWVDKATGTKDMTHNGKSCSLRCHQNVSTDEYNEERAGRNYVKEE